MKNFSPQPDLVWTAAAISGQILGHGGGVGEGEGGGGGEVELFCLVGVKGGVKNRTAPAEADTAATGA